MVAKKIRLRQQKLDDLENPGQIVLKFLPEDGSACSDIELSTNLAGVKINKVRLSSEEELQDFAFWLSQAWTEHRKIKRELNKQLTGQGLLI